MNYGFSAYTLVSAAPEEPLPALPVTMGEAEQVGLTLPETGVTAVVEKAQASSLEYRVDLPETLAAPIQQGQQVGTLTLCSGDTEVLTVPILAAESGPGRSWGWMFSRRCSWRSARRGKAGESPVFPLVFSPETLYDRANSCIAPTRRF